MAFAREIYNSRNLILNANIGDYSQRFLIYNSRNLILNANNYDKAIVDKSTTVEI